LIYKRVWGFIFFCVVSSEASFLDLYTSAGKEGECINTVSSLLKAAYVHYPSISASRQMILSANAQIESAKWNYFPTPSVDISQRAGQRGIIYRVDQPLWTGGKLDAISDLAAARSDEAANTLGESSYVLAQKVLSVLQNYIQADGEIRGFSEGKKQLESLAEMLDRRIEAGISATSDRELLNARISQIDADLMIAQSRYDMAQSQLELLTGKKINCAIDFAKDSVLRGKKPLEQMEEEMMRTHPTLKKMDAQVTMAQAEKKSADAAIMPNVSLRVEHQRGSVFENVSVDSETVAYVALSFNPGAGLSAMSNIESAKYKVLQAKEERRVQEQQLKDILVMDYSDFTAALGRTESIQQTIQASQKVLESYKRLFITGKRQWLDLVNASREVTQSQIALATLRAVFVTSAYRLALQTGKIDFSEKKGSR